MNMGRDPTEITKKNEVTNISKQLDKRETVAGFPRRCNVFFYLQGSVSCGHFTE